MSVYINFKICDNAEECSGIAVCPVKSLYWDDIEKTVAIDNSRCLTCDACMEACPAGAIRVAHSEEESIQIQEDIDNDPRTIHDLMVERYGASPVSENILISIRDAEEKIAEKTLLIAIEIIDDNDTPCLINSVPISEAFGSVNIEYYKVTVNDNAYDCFAKKYDVTACPTLLVFRRGILLVRMDGPVENNDYQQRINFLNKIRSSLDC